MTAGVVGGAVNAAAGGAKLFVFPMLLAAGLPPVAANATATAALWPALAPAAWVYRDRFAGDAGALLRGSAPALGGALLGALALILGGDRAFTALVPVFLAVAVGAILLGERLAALGRRAGLGSPGGVAAILFVSGFYGGYFGAGLGFMLVAVLTLSGVADPQDANARKTLYAVLINTTAFAPIAMSGLVDWRAAALVAAGGLLGGFGGAKLVRRLPARPMRWLVAALGSGLTVAFLMR